MHTKLLQGEALISRAQKLTAPRSSSLWVSQPVTQIVMPH